MKMNDEMKVLESLQKVIQEVEAEGKEQEFKNAFEKTLQDGITEMQDNEKRSKER